MSQFKHQKIV